MSEWQRCIGPGRWIIGGYEVQRVGKVWRAGLEGGVPVFVAETLREISGAIAKKQLGSPPNASTLDVKEVP